MPKGGIGQKNESIGAAEGTSGRGCNNCSDSKGVKWHMSKADFDLLVEFSKAFTIGNILDSCSSVNKQNGKCCRLVLFSFNQIPILRTEARG